MNNQIKSEKWALRGQRAITWLGNGDDVVADSKENLKAMFRPCVEGDWSNLYERNGVLYTKKTAIELLWEEFETLATEISNEE